MPSGADDLAMSNALDLMNKVEDNNIPGPTWPWHWLDTTGAETTKTSDIAFVRCWKKNVHETSMCGCALILETYICNHSQLKLGTHQ